MADSPEESKEKVSLSQRASRFQNKINSYEKPKKVTRDDILNKWDDSYDRRVQLAQNAKKPTVVGKVIAGVSLLMTAGLIFSANSSSFEADSAKNEQSISSLKSQLNDAQSRAKEVPTQVDAAKLITDANAAGQKFAKIQNDMLPLTKPATRDSAKLKSLALDMSKSMTDDIKASVSPWYVITWAKENPYHAMKYSWQAQTPYSFEADGENVKVVWLCKDDKGTLLAWTIAKFNAKDHKFSGIVRGMTKAGSDRVGTPIDSDPATNIPDSGGK